MPQTHLLSLMALHEVITEDAFEALIFTLLNQLLGYNMLNTKVLAYLESHNIKDNEISGIAIKFDIEQGLSIHLNLKRRGNNTHKIPLKDDWEKKDRLVKIFMDFLKPQRIRHIEGLKGLEDL